MTYHDKNLNRNMSLVDAVDALSLIAELDSEQEIVKQVDQHLIENRWDKEHSEKTLSAYLDGKNVDLDVIKNIFRTILHHLKNLYSNDSIYVADEKKNERVKTIMVLIGEAAAKLDRLTSLFHHAHAKSVYELKEFKQLQEFYITRIAKKIDQGLLSKWILGIAAGQSLVKDDVEVKTPDQNPLHTKHVFIDLEGVKKDSEYELFFIRKEDGTRFFNPKLIRSIKLVCDFGSYFKSGKIDDPFADIHLQVDRSLHHTAKNMVDSLKKCMQRFYREISSYKQSEMALILNKAMIALMLAANSRNLKRNDPIKSCSEYFTDFQVFLRQALQTREYQRIVAYPEQVLNGCNSCLMDTVNGLTYALHTSKPEIQEMISYVENIIHEASSLQSKEHLDAAKNSKQLWSVLGCNYSAMCKLIKSHPNGHLKKILEMVEEGNYQHYDPLFQYNIPMEMYHLYSDNSKMVNIRIPAPVYQENIQKVVITEEFKAFLRSLNKGQESESLLIFNFQDRTSWREHARAKALEDLQKNPEFSNCLTVVTIPKDTEFYRQDSPYHAESHADVFMENLKNQILDENAGFNLPNHLKGLENFIDPAMKIVHSLFFHSKNVLTRDQRLDFIEIFYFFLELKILDLVKPDFFSFTCKDAIDISSAANAMLFACLKILNQEKLSENDMEFMDFLIYGLPLSIRERLILQERFDRMLNAIKVFELAKSEHGSLLFSKLVTEAFVLLYETNILESKSFFNKTSSGW